MARARRASGWRGGGSARASRRRRNAKARRAANRDDAVTYECVDGETYCDGRHARALGRACAALRTRCFYEFEREETFTYDFSYDEDDDSAAYLRARLRWWEDRIASETLREPMMRQAGVRSLRTFAALARTDASGRRAGFEESSTTGETPADAEALRRWSIVHEGADANADTSVAESHLAVVGTLDVHLGAKLPGEILVGRRPFADASADAANDQYGFDPLAVVDPPRAYVFNVCVAPEFRGRGVGGRAGHHRRAPGGDSLRLHHDSAISAADGAQGDADHGGSDDRPATIVGTIDGRQGDSRGMGRSPRDGRPGAHDRGGRGARCDNGH